MAYQSLPATQACKHFGYQFILLCFLIPDTLPLFHIHLSLFLFHDFKLISPRVQSVSQFFPVAK